MIDKDHVMKQINNPRKGYYLNFVHRDDLEDWKTFATENKLTTITASCLAPSPKHRQLVLYRDADWREEVRRSGTFNQVALEKEDGYVHVATDQTLLDIGYSYFLVRKPKAK